MAIVIIGAIGGTSSEKPIQELDLKNLKSRCWLRKLCLFYKLIKEKSLAYLFQLIPENNTPYTTKCSKKSNSFFQDKDNLFQNSFSSAVITEWINVNICNSASCNVFSKVILNIVRPEPNQVFNVESSKGLKFLTRIRLSHLTDHKFRHDFQDSTDLICSCSQESETSTHFLFNGSNYYSAR